LHYYEIWLANGREVVAEIEAGRERYGLQIGFFRSVNDVQLPVAPRYIK
jgi:hypothetical protein